MLNISVFQQESDEDEPAIKIKVTEKLIQLLFGVYERSSTQCEWLVWNYYDCAWTNNNRSILNRSNLSQIYVITKTPNVILKAFEYIWLFFYHYFFLVIFGFQNISGEQEFLEELRVTRISSSLLRVRYFPLILSEKFLRVLEIE